MKSSSSWPTWARTLYRSMNIQLENLALSLQCLRDVLLERLPLEISCSAVAFIDHSTKTLGKTPLVAPSFIQHNQPYAALAQRYLGALLSQDRRGASQVISEAIQTGIGVKALYLQVFQPCQFEIGRLWHLNQVSIPQEHFCTAVTQTLIGHMYQAIFTTPRNGRTAVVACVGGELHDLGARMVADFLEIDGWDTLYLGANTPSESIAHMAQQNNADLLCLSVTISSHIREVMKTIAAVRQSCGGREIAIMVGGHPFRVAPDLWRQVGADGYAPDAQSAIDMANTLVTRQNALVME